MTGYSEEGDEVVLRITRTDYGGLVFLLGVVTGLAKDAQTQHIALRLANSINAGNPNWTPYKVSEKSE